MKRILLVLVAVVALAGCEVGYPWPDTEPTEGHRDVMLIGDSLMGNTYSAFALAFGGVDVTVIDRHVNGSGLTSPILGLDPLDYVNEQLDAYPDTDLVIAEWAGACETPCAYEYGSPEWVAAWEAKAHEIIDAVRARGVMIMWSLSPPPPPGMTPGPPYTFSDDGSNAVGFGVPLRLRAQTGVPLVNMRQALAVNDGLFGHYDALLWWDFLGWSEHEVRLGDAIHLSADGSFRAAFWTRAALTAVWPDIPSLDPSIGALRAADGPDPIEQPAVEGTP